MGSEREMDLKLQIHSSGQQTLAMMRDHTRRFSRGTLMKIGYTRATRKQHNKISTP
jgi:hypothetical protein